MFFSRFTQCAAALLLLTIGFAAPVHAQNNKQIISGTFYEDRATVNTSASGNYLTFSQTPPNQFLNITNVSCFVQLNATQILGNMQINAGTYSGGTDLSRPYTIRGSNVPETTSTARYYSIVTDQVFYKLGPGRDPSIYIYTPSSNGTYFDYLDCVIVGNLTNS